MSDWTIPGDHEVNKNFGADFDVSSSHHDFKSGVFTCTLEMRDAGTGEWLGPKVFVKADASGAEIRDLSGTVVWSSGTINFAHAGVQALLDRAKIVTFVSARVPDPR